VGRLRDLVEGARSAWLGTWLPLDVWQFCRESRLSVALWIECVVGSRCTLDFAGRVVALGHETSVSRQGRLDLVGCLVGVVY